MDTTGTPTGRTTRPNGLYWTAMGVLAVMVVLNFSFWLDGQVEPTILGLPIVFTYHLVYAAAASAVLWLVFKAIWPTEDGDASPDDVIEEG